MREVRLRVRTLLVATMVAVRAAGSQPVAGPDSFPAIDRSHLYGTIAALAADSMEGRKVGTPGGARARAFLLRQFAAIGLEPAVKGYTAEFSVDLPVRRAASPLQPNVPNQRPPISQLPVKRAVYGTNLIGVVRGTLHPERYILVSAHYDHVGVIQDEIYNGADDNASGSAAIFVIAEWAIAHPPRNSLLFTWFDGEEEGLLGSKAFAAHPPVPLASIAADVNLDMVSRNVRGELFAAGTNRWPVMKPLVDSLAIIAPVTLLEGHDGVPDQDDWTFRSDMGPFHQRGIPFVSFDVEEHADYHRPTDVVAHIQPEFYYRAVRTAAEFIRMLDASLDPVAQVRRGKE